MLKVSEIAMDKLNPWENNPRINDHVVDSVAKSIKSFGFNVPILYDQNFTIIAGHTRWKAAKKIGMTHVPAIQLNLSESQRKAFSIADNKLASLADWDDEMLTKLIEELKLDDFDISSIGYSEAEMEALLAPYKDFNWEEFNEYMAKEMESVFAILQVKVKDAVKKTLRTSIEKYAVEHDLEDKDSAILAGKVVGHLLGVEQ